VTAVDLPYDLSGPTGAPVLVLSNAIGSSRALWEPQAGPLGERFRLLRYEHRGHAGAPVPPGDYVLDDLGADVLALLERLGLQRVHWCGLSLGGAVGMWLAVHAPERLDRLVLCCTSARFSPLETWAERAATVRAQGMAAIADGVLERWVTAPFAAAHPGVVARLRAMLLAMPAEGYARCCHVLGAVDLEDDLGAVRAPTLVIAGADDPATPPDHGELIAARVPGARLVVVPDAAHLANVEQVEAVTGLILGHLLAPSTAEDRP
jgi:3-oxoadipate enol-lactonase